MAKASVTTLSNNDKPIGVERIKVKGAKYLVSFDNDSEILFTADQLVTYRISLDKRFTTDELDQIKKDANLDLWLNKAMGYISYKLRTEKEIKDYLKVKSDLELVDQQKIIAKLKSHGLINDYEYALHYMEDCKNKNRGKRYFSNHLSALGVARSIIEQVLLQFDEASLIDSLIIKYQKEASHLSKYPKIIQKQKLEEKMIRNGLSTSTIQQVISQIELVEDYDEAFEKDFDKISKKTDESSKQISYLLQKGYPYEYIRKRMNQK